MIKPASDVIPGYFYGDGQTLGMSSGLWVLQ